MRRLLLACSLLVLAYGCDRAPSITGPQRGAPPAFGIFDGAHGGGNADFFFLPPMVPNPSKNPTYRAGAFNPNLRPSVEICELSGSACGPLVKRFVGDEISLGSEMYQVDWDTKSSSLIATKIYRVQVLVGTTVLGFADVDPVTNGGELRNVQTGEYIGLVNGRTLPIRFRIQHGALCERPEDCVSVTVSESGGTVTVPSGEAGAEFPSGWLPEGFTEVTVTIERIETTPTARCHPSTLPQWECYEYKTDPVVPQFAELVRVGMCIDPAALASPLHHSLQLHSTSEVYGTRALPNVFVDFLECGGPAPIGAAPGSVRYYAARTQRALTSTLGSLFLPREAHAVDRGLGGLTDAFSRIGWMYTAELEYSGEGAIEGVAGEPLEEPVSVRLMTGHHDPVPLPGIGVTFRILTAGGTLGTGTAREVIVPTNADGFASTSWTLSDSAGLNQLEVVVVGAEGSPLVIDAEGFAFPPVVVTTRSDTLYAIGDTMTVVAQSFDRGSPRDEGFTFVSSNPTVLTVSGSGLVTAISNGVATVTATDDRELSASKTIVVMQTPAIAETFSEGATFARVATPTDPLSVRIFDARGNSMAGVPVTFAVTRGGGSVANAQVLTNSDGVATSGSWTLGPTPTLNVVTASASGSATATFEAIAEPIDAQIAVGTFHTCAKGENTAAHCWGQNTSRQIGNGTSGGQVDVPTPVSGASSISALQATGGRHTCALGAENEALCWGDNGFGQLGTGTPASPTEPVVVTGGLSFSEVKGGRLHSCGVTLQGIGYCWGNNQSGEGGNGTGSPGTNSFTPIPVAWQGTFRLITPGWIHSCGIAADGTALCWGANGSGQLGDGTQESRLTPTPVAGGHTFRSLSAGSDHTCGITTSGQTLCWGANAGGQLGDGTTTMRMVPTPVASSLEFTVVAAGVNITTQGVNTNQNFTCALTAQGAAYCWGGNPDGQLGDGTLTNRSVPTAVSVGATFTSIAGGNGHACALTLSSTVYCWGRNAEGQLGDGTLVGRPVPARVAGPF